MKNLGTPVEKEIQTIARDIASQVYEVKEMSLVSDSKIDSVLEHSRVAVARLGEVEVYSLDHFDLFNFQKVTSPKKYIIFHPQRTAIATKNEIKQFDQLKFEFIG